MKTDGVCVGDLEICAHEHAVLVCGREVQLSSREFEIVRMLSEHPGWVYSSAQLAGEPEDGDYSPESISVLVSRLRHKLAAAGAHDAVETVRGVGYRLRPIRQPDAGSGDDASTSRELRNASWRLQEAVIEVEHSGSSQQQRIATEVLENARRAIFADLAE